MVSSAEEIMQISLSFPEETFETLLRLAAEDEETAIENLLKNLVEAEDQRRHVQYPPYQAEQTPGHNERRAKCGRTLCSETQERWENLPVEEY